MGYSPFAPTSHAPVASIRPPPLRNELRNEARRGPRRARDVRPAGVEDRVRDRRRGDVVFTERVDLLVVGGKEIALPVAASSRSATGRSPRGGTTLIWRATIGSSAERSAPGMDRPAHGGCARRAGRRLLCRCARSKPDRLNEAVGLGLGQLATGVSGFISYDFCRLAGRVPRPSFTFLFHGASMRCFVSSSIDLGSRLR